MKLRLRWKNVSWIFHNERKSLAIVVKEMPQHNLIKNELNKFKIEENFAFSLRIQICVSSFVRRRSWVYVVNVLHIKNSIQLCKLLINFNQIVCCHHYSTKGIKWSPSFALSGAHTFVCGNTNCDPMIPIKRNRIPNTPSIALVYEYILIECARSATIRNDKNARFIFTKWKWIHSKLLNLCNKRKGWEQTKRWRSSFCGMFRIFALFWNMFLSCVCKRYACDDWKTSHSMHSFEFIWNKLLRSRISKQMATVRIDFIFAAIKCNWNSSNSIRSKIKRNWEKGRKKEIERAERKESRIYHNELHILQHSHFDRLLIGTDLSTCFSMKWGILINLVEIQLEIQC